MHGMAKALDAVRVLSFPNSHSEEDVEMAGLVLMHLAAKAALRGLDDSMLALWEGHLRACYEDIQAIRDAQTEETP